MILWLTLVITAMPSLAAVKGHDYYGNDFPPGLLVNVEKYHLEPGRDKLSHGRYSYAMADARFMLAYFPNNPNALKLAMEIALQWPEHNTEAEPFFEKAIDSYPQHGETYLIYGVYLHRLGKVEDAVAEYKKAIERDPRSAEAHYNLGLALVALDRFDEANVAAHKAYALGHPLPGLKNELKSHGAWQPVKEDEK
ncbi:MAG: tetratricopeptide repeat protein [Nitrococcus mobilis]|nr:tetratricopeptide repeat protein [Nitrococcus mobilis]